MEATSQTCQVNIELSRSHESLKFISRALESCSEPDHISWHTCWRTRHSLVTSRRDLPAVRQKSLRRNWSCCSHECLASLLASRTWESGSCQADELCRCFHIWQVCGRNLLQAAAAFGEVHWELAEGWRSASYLLIPED